MKDQCALSGRKERRDASPFGSRFYTGILVALLASSQAVFAEAIPPISGTADAAPALEDELVISPTETMPSITPDRRSARFAGEAASDSARQMADWVVGSSDNHGLPFAIVDKTDAKVFVFDSEGMLLGAAPALIGLAVGDDSVAGIGERKLSDIMPDERTTPAGRFVAALGENLGGQDILWVDYDTAISLHRVVTTSLTERRLERLATASPLDNRISYGCINVPVGFYESIVNPTFTGTNGIVYILPEAKPIENVFTAYDVN